MSEAHYEPVYPSTVIDDGAQMTTTTHYLGLSVRDYFAARAMEAYLRGNSALGEEDIAELAYAQANAMMAERAK